MREVLRSNDLVHLSLVDATLKDAGIEHIVLDAHTSAIEGSIGAIQRRVLVVDDDFEAAVLALEDAGALERRG